MLKSKCMSKEFWAKLMQCVVYMRNQCIHSKFASETLHEAWSDHKLIESNLKVIDSVTYTHVPDQRRNEFDDKSEKYVFIGYDKEHECFKCFIQLTKK